MNSVQAAAHDPIARVWLGSEWFRYLDAPIEQPTDARVAAGAVAVGIAFDIAMRSGVIGAGGAVCVLLAAAALLLSGRVTNPHGQAMIAAAPFFGIWLMVRTSDWLVLPNIAAAAALIGFGASFARGGSALDQTIPHLAGRGVRGCLQALSAPSFLWRSFLPATGSRRGGRTGAVVRGLLIVAPLVIVLGALLVSADAVFASFFSFDASGVAEHAVVLVVGALAMAGLFRLASTVPASNPDVEGGKLGAVEAFVVLFALNGLLGAFAVARLIALSEGGRGVLSSAGLTYAEYARTGFFQLLFAAIIVIGAILALRATVDLSTSSEQRAFVGLSLGVVGLTIAVCVSAFHRLVLYEAAFGLTMLRVFVQTAIVWVGIVLMMLGVAVALPHVRRAWLAPAAAMAGLLLLFALNMFNPESFVARHNVAHPPSGDGLDAGYLSGLSDDAVVELLPSASKDLRSRICGTRSPRTTGWASYNLARARADQARSEMCH